MKHPKLQPLTAGQREKVLSEALRLACLSLHKNIEGKTNWWLEGFIEQALINTEIAPLRVVPPQPKQRKSVVPS